MRLSYSTLHRAVDASAIEASRLAAQAGGMEICHFVGSTASSGQASGYQALQCLVLLAAAGGKVIAIAPSILRIALHGAQHVLQLGEVARHDCVADSDQRAGGAFAVLGQLLGGAGLAAGTALADQRECRRLLIRQMLAGSL